LLFKDRYGYVSYWELYFGKIMKSKITIITVCYNSIITIETTIRSVIDQTYKNIEYIIIDGGSTDGTLDVINIYGNYVDKFISESDKSQYDKN